ncbi:MAG: pyruvate:ferredoxin (flavodoxin) oxidoreductase [Clostridia bacterium]|nr:pyruvate:ferredoxin (flavodoxin) oxidoreductase [Clostridia bacterium]
MSKMIMDGNTAAAHVSYALLEIAVVYPITPSSPMAELADTWQAAGKCNVFGNVPKVVEMQSESGAAGALHGALTCGALATTYTCSQGLLLMLPNMYKIAGELLPTVFHVSARALATHALSIFGDHQDVMACRQTGFAMLSSGSVQEVMDLALVAHLAALESSVPFLHFFDGFRTSHEQATIEPIDYADIKALVPMEKVDAFRNRALDPNRPCQRGTAQNGDIYFQNREAANSFYLALPNIVQNAMDKVAKITKRAYHVFDYHGNPEAEYVVVIMGSGGVTMEETVDFLNEKGWKIGVVKVRLYRPFDRERFLAAIPKTCKKIAVLDRTKEAGALGEPLYLDVCGAIQESKRTDLQVIGGRYGLGSKEFTPSMCLAIFKNLQTTTPKNHFTIGIDDDVTHTSLDFSEKIITLNEDCTSCKFYGLGSDGTVGANKNSVKILGEHTNLHVQAYFCYDSKKSGGLTVSHLRFGKHPIHSPYLVDHADFVACHNPSYLTRYDMLSDCKENGIFLLNAPAQSLENLEKLLPSHVKRQIAQKNLRFYVIDGTKIANDVGLNGRTSTVMQAAFFFLMPLLPYEKAISYLKTELENKFSKKGQDLVKRNFAAVDAAEKSLKKIDYPKAWSSLTDDKPFLQESDHAYFRNFSAPILAMQGDHLPVSAFSPDGSVPTGTSRHERRGIAYLLPKWIPENCIQCNQCSFVCPHATIRPILLDETTQAPPTFITRPAIGMAGKRFRIQVVAQHCMGCGVCANVCPAKNKALVMTPSSEIGNIEKENWSFASHLPPISTEIFKKSTVKGSQFQQPLFEFSYACAGCGETPYIKILTQLFGEKMIIANATGCSSIYGGSAPTCPYTVNKEGHGPAWANSLFEDNAEFGLGMRLAWAYRERNKIKDKSVWIIGGDGWAYDIGYGGLDHVLASGENVNVLVLDSEVYSNTGGQTSKATPMGAVARFSALGKRIKKKPLGLMAMAYGYVYVAQVAIGADKQQFLKAITEAEAYDGPSLIIAYSPCISHGIRMENCMEEEKAAVECGHWTLFRYHPDLAKEGKNPFILDSKTQNGNLRDFLMRENRFSSLHKSDPENADRIFREAEQECNERIALYHSLAKGKDRS